MGRINKTGTWLMAALVLAALQFAVPPASGHARAASTGCGLRQIRSALTSDAAAAGQAVAPGARAAWPRQLARLLARRTRPSAASARRISAALRAGESDAICAMRAGRRRLPDRSLRGLTAAELAYMDGQWALTAHGDGGRSIAQAAVRQAGRCLAAADARLRLPGPRAGGCDYAAPGFATEGQATEGTGCRSGPVLPIHTNPHAPATTQGRVLPGTQLQSQVVQGLPAPFVQGGPLQPHYPNGQLPAGPPQWRNLSAVPPSEIVHTDAAQEFNGPNARYRIAFNLSHYGGAPVNIGDVSGNGADDLAISDHFAYVDGREFAGEVDVYDGGRGHTLDPATQDPNLIVYGDQAGGKFGISIAPAGDVNGDGWPDWIVTAAFHSADNGTIPFGGTAYLIYGGFLQQFRCTVKVRSSAIGWTIPGIEFDGGAGGVLYTGWANELDGGDENGDGYSDLLIGAYDQYDAPPVGHGARATLVFGSPSLPLLAHGYRLGAQHRQGAIRSLDFVDPVAQDTQQSLGFSASFAGDVTGSGRDAIALTAAHGGTNGDGAAYIFTRKLSPGTPSPIQFTSADTTVEADQLDAGDTHLRFIGIASARPAGDVNGDGTPDIVITARNTQSLLGGSWTTVGAAGVLDGHPGGLPAQIGFSQLDHIFYGDEAGALGQPASEHGAAFGDDDRASVLLDDASYLEPIGGALQQRGRMWLLQVGPDTPQLVDVEASASRYFLADTTLPGLFGYTWDTGDFNGDGCQDLVVGDHYLGDQALDIHAGAAYLYYGGPNLSFSAVPGAACHR